ncbi:MAG: hypothetical protein L3J59_03895 [Methylococcaceae bacterium]|nr:hypothetical protein [Methylococcaceae bacterium]
MIKKTKIALGIATTILTMAGALVSPQVVAQTQAEKTAALEAQVNEMAIMMQSMQAELNRVKAVATNADTAKVQELDQWMASMKNTPVHRASKDNLASVRGGWSRFKNTRGSNEGLFGVGDDLLTDETDKDAFYYGAAFDFNINNDFFGIADNTSFMIEFGLDYSEVGEKHDNGFDNLLTAATGPDGVTGGVPTDLQQTVTVNMLRINVSPKIKFMHGSKFRPWIIPVGVDFNIISPPSDAITVLNTGMNFGAGVEYELFRGIVAGLDGRYHWTPDDVDGVDTDGFTLGGSVGFKF